MTGNYGPEGGLGRRKKRQPGPIAVRAELLSAAEPIVPIVVPPLDRPIPVDTVAIQAMLLSCHQRLSSEDLPNKDFVMLAGLVRDFAKLSFDLDKQQRPVRHQHAHIHGTAAAIDPARHRLLEIAARAGVSILPG